ncbi:MAG TPA: hypothetical protein VGC64_03860, partial [Pyrinomonadaceae bacterium]
MDKKKEQGMFSEPEIQADAFERELTTDLDDETPDRPKGMALHTRILIGLLVGVVAGVAVNSVFRVNSLFRPGSIFSPDYFSQPAARITHSNVEW